MKTLRDRLAFALCFAQMGDLSMLRQGERRKVKDDLAAFIGFMAPRPFAARVQPGAALIQVAAIDFPSAQQIPDDYVMKLQAEVKRLVAPPTLPSGVPGARGLLVNPKDYISVALACRPTLLGVGAYRFFDFSGTVRDLFLVSLLILLLQMPGDQIRRCPSCDKVFVRIRKQRYCSKTCTDRISKRKERARNGA